MFVSDERVDVTQISLTGTRALALIGLLIVEPHSFDEIKKKFLEIGLFDKKSSEDILRIDIGTIKTMGCELSRPCLSNGYKYVIKKHPFSLDLTIDDIKLLKRAYNRIKSNVTLENLIEYDDLFKKIAKFIYNDEIKEALFGISILKYYNVEELKEVLADCKSQKIIELIYRYQETKKETIKKIKAQKLAFQNDKLYLYGYDYEKQNSTVLMYKRIKNIISKTEDEKRIETKNLVITYQLQDFDKDLLLEDEKIIQEGKEKFIVEGSFYNDFYAIQRILSLGSKCTIISPNDFKISVINKLKEMKEVYNG